MKKPWENDSCGAVQAYFSVYRVPVAAALWCGIPPEELEEHFAQCTEVVKGVLKHPYIRCMEPRCRAIHDAIVNGVLPCSRENGRVVTEHVAPDRRHVSRQHLKDWIAAEFPSDKPAFLFDEIERDTHKAISADTYRSLQADRDALKVRVDNAVEEYRKLKSDRDSLAKEVTRLTAPAASATPLGQRAETTYLNIIGAMLDLFLSNAPSGKPHSVFTSQGSLIDCLVATYGNRDGISKRGIEEKFAAARRSLGS